MKLSLLLSDPIESRISLPTSENYTPVAVEHFIFLLGLTEAVTYDDGCSCGLNKTCTVQANFVKFNSSEIVPVQGLKVGCTPTESLLASTLECFYNASCITLIQAQTNYITSIDATNPPVSLFANTTRFAIHTTVEDLVRKLFIEDWSTSTNYSLYFDQCSPLSCFYTYIQRLNSFYTITLMLSLYGGLSVTLKWLCPRIVLIMFKAFHCRKKRMNMVEAPGSIKIATMEPKNNPNASVDLRSLPTVLAAQ